MINLRDRQLIIFRATVNGEYRSKVTLTYGVLTPLSFPNIQIDVRQLIHYDLEYLCQASMYNVSASARMDNLKFDKLAQLNVAGENIRIIALNAAFLVADAREPVQMKHLLQAA